MRRKGTAFFLLSLAYLSQTFADEAICSSQEDINHVSIRHIESKGIGYNEGYTTLDGFFVPLSTLDTRWIPFLDVRGHIFNNGKPAANAGIGFRYIESRVWGSNVYYDYRKTSHHNYNQISFGLESLGRYLDYRINGYFPLGRHKGSLSNPSFDSFSGNSFYVTRKQELALKGGNAEVGVHIAKIKGIDFYSAIGPYYFGNDTKHTFGGKFRIGMDVMKIFRIEGNTSYDHLFKWIGQGQVSLSYAFTPKTMNRKQKKGGCSFHGFVRERAFQRVDKQEIVVVTTQKKKSLAINPVTGLPWVVWFVDNTSHSQGTYESPFNTLAQAGSSSGPNDIIAILPGNGTDTNMDSGIILQAGQKLWGMSVAHEVPTTLGIIKIKPLSNQMPVISNSKNPSADVIDGVGGNEIVGLKIMETQGNPAIYVQNTIGNYTIEKNIISTISGFGIYMTGVDSIGTSTIVNNTFMAGDGVSSTNGIVLTQCSGDLAIGNNLFTGIDTNSGFQIAINISYGSKQLQCSVLDNIVKFYPDISNINGGIYLIDGTNPTSTFLVEDNKIDIPFNPIAVAGIAVRPGGFFFGTLRNNEVTSFDPSTVPPYKFIKSGSGSLSQINFSPDNIGKIKYQGF